MPTTQVNPGGFNLASAISGFALGAVITMFAFVAVNPSTAVTSVAAPAAANDGGATTLSLSDPQAAAALPSVGQTRTLSNGSTLTRLAGGQLQLTDRTGHTRTVLVGGSAGTQSQTVGGSAGTQSQTVGGSAGSQSRTVGGSAGSQGTNGSSSSSAQGGSNGGASGSGTVTDPGSGGTSGCTGGASDTGVTSSSVKLGATVAETGIAQAFLGEARQGIEAFKNRVNANGGVCGRTLDVKYVDDGWSSDAGKTDLENLINDDKVFAIAVAPSSEGVNAASVAGTFRNAGVPVVGTDGLDASQYKDPYIWPVAAATVTMLHVMMQKAWNDGASNPAIVFDSQYKFGSEGANALEKAYERLSGGKTIPGAGSSSCAAGSRFCPISAASGQYGNQVSIINNSCFNTRPHCDYLVLLMEPDTAQQWMATPGAPTAAQLGAGGLGAAQPLFTYSFGTTCGDRCNGMQVWTGYNPPLEQFATQDGVKKYVGDLHNQKSSADAYNQFTEGSYLGMQLLVAAMERVGANLTRVQLKAALDSLTLNTGLAPAAESWSPGQHWAVPGAQAFTMQSVNGFSGWRFTTPFLKDPWLGQDFG